jgi:radical SAM-linked protein
VDFELTQSMDVEQFKERLASQLPKDVPVYRVEEVSLTAPAATQVLERAEYCITVAATQGASLQQLQDWIEAIKRQEAIWWEKTTKSRKKQQVNLRDRLFELELVESDKPEAYLTESAVVRSVGSCRNDGTLLRPEHLVYMLEQVSEQEWELLHSHRQQLILANV